LLTWAFITKYKGVLRKTVDSIPQETMDFLTSYEWPGNVRELANVIERAMILSPGTTLKIEETVAAVAPPHPRKNQSGPKRLDLLERDHILAVLEECGWRVKGKGNAAEQLGLKPSTLFARMKKHGIKRPK
jgi:DNA-binding NtrC family response regulator